MAPTVYKNSKIATVISVIGYLAITGGVYCIFHDEPIVGIILLALGFGCYFLSAFISNMKKKKKSDSSNN